MVTQGVCVFWQSLPWLRRDIDGIHACGLFGRARTLTSKIPDHCIGRCTLDAFARLTPEEFGRFRERVALDGPKKGRTRLKQVFKQALKAAPQVWLPFLHQCFLFWCICCPSNLVDGCCCVPGPTSWAWGPCVVGRAQTIGDERRGCVPSGRWIGWHCDGGGALRLVNTSKIS
jgi:hypothetical protein